MMFSKHNNKGSVNPNAQVYGEDNRSAALNAAVNNAVGRGMSRDNFNNLKPKAIAHAADAASYAQAANVSRFSGDEDTVDGPTTATELHHKTARRTASRE